jgi:hypothetical protein
MAYFRKKPVVIQAIQWTGENIIEVAQFMAPVKPVYLGNDAQVGIDTLEGRMAADLNDWIIRGVAGELYPCKPEIFAATYEPIDPPSADVSVYPFLLVHDGQDRRITHSFTRGQAVSHCGRHITHSQLIADCRGMKATTELPTCPACREVVQARGAG